MGKKSESRWVQFTSNEYVVKRRVIELTGQGEVFALEIEHGILLDVVNCVTVIPFYQKTTLKARKQPALFEEWRETFPEWEKDLLMDINELSIDGDRHGNRRWRKNNSML
jgi:hypothetical protein